MGEGGQMHFVKGLREYYQTRQARTNRASWHEQPLVSEPSLILTMRVEFDDASHNNKDGEGLLPA